MIEEDDVFDSNNFVGASSASENEKKKLNQHDTANDVTYDTLHGVSSPNNVIDKESADYDIFDDLC